MNSSPKFKYLKRSSKKSSKTLEKINELEISSATYLPFMALGACSFGLRIYFRKITLDYVVQVACILICPSMLEIHPTQFDITPQLCSGDSSLPQIFKIPILGFTS